MVPKKSIHTEYVLERFGVIITGTGSDMYRNRLNSIFMV